MCIPASSKACEIKSDTWEVLAADRTLWRSVNRSAMETAEKAGFDHLAEKRFQRKNRITKPDNGCVCSLCNRVCGSCVRLFLHQRTHRLDSSCGRLTPSPPDNILVGTYPLPFGYYGVRPSVSELAKAPSTPATMSKSKQRSTCNIRHCCWCGRGLSCRGVTVDAGGRSAVVRR